MLNISKYTKKFSGKKVPDTKHTKDFTIRKEAFNSLCLQQFFPRPFLISNFQVRVFICYFFLSFTYDEL